MKPSIKAEKAYIIICSLYRIIISSQREVFRKQLSLKFLELLLRDNQNSHQNLGKNTFLY